jgi:hypothetical protein
MYICSYINIHITYYTCEFQRCRKQQQDATSIQKHACMCSTHSKHVIPLTMVATIPGLPTQKNKEKLKRKFFIEK